MTTAEYMIAFVLFIVHMYF